MHIDRERLATFFSELCAIPSPSKSEKRVADYLQQRFTALGAGGIDMDDSMQITGSDTGNLIVSFAGDEAVGAPLFFACHMDTVGPTGDVISVVRTGDVFTSGGDTVLGADDKSGIAALLELISRLQETGTPHCPMELVFTTCEEIGLRGAKAMAADFITAPYGYALDSTSKDAIIIGAPAANRIMIEVHGRAAHSGLAPEKGTNALSVAAQAINQLTLGRLDQLSTANFGLISGGTAINIVPEKLILEGEVRSHSQSLLDYHTRHIEQVFSQVASHWPVASNGLPTISFNALEEFPLMRLAEDEPVLKRLSASAGKLDYPLSFDIAGGGSDANIFSGRGLPTAILPTGMSSVHSTDEYVHLDDMVRLTGLLAAMVTGMA